MCCCWHFDFKEQFRFWSERCNIGIRLNWNGSTDTKNKQKMIRLLIATVVFIGVILSFRVCLDTKLLVFANQEDIVKAAARFI